MVNPQTLGRRSFLYGDDWLVEEHLLVAGANPREPRWVVGTALDLIRKATAVSVFDVDDIAAGGWRLDGDGMLAIPERPGLGVEINLDALAEHSRVPLPELRARLG